MPDITSINAQNAGFFSELAYQEIGSALIINKSDARDFTGWTEIDSIPVNGTQQSLKILFLEAGIPPNTANAAGSRVLRSRQECVLGLNEAILQMLSEMPVSFCAFCQPTGGWSGKRSAVLRPGSRVVNCA